MYVEINKNPETKMKAPPIPKLSARTPKTVAIIAVITVFNNDWTERIDVKISFGTLSEIKPVKIGFLIFSIIYIMINAIIENIHKSKI